MNFYERAAKLIEVRSPHSSRPHKPQSGSRSRPTGRGPMTDAERKKDKETGDAATATVLKKSAEIAAKKKGDGDVDEWGSGQAVAQKDKRQADRKEKTGQSTVPHKYGRAQSLGPPGTFSDKDKEPYSDANKAKQQAQMDKDDAAAHAAQDAKKKINASKKKKKVKEETYNVEELFGSIYSEITTGQLNEMAMNATKKGKKKKKINDEDDDQIERDEADRQERLAAAEDEEEAKTGQAEANTKGPDTDPNDKSDAVKKLSKTAQGSAERGNPATTDSGWRDKSTGKPTFAPKGTSSLNAAKKGKLKKKVVSAMKEGEDKDWIQKAVDPDHEGYCTPMTKSTCTPKRKALAKTFKKMGKKRDRETKAKDEK